jgi:hypothetical protein
LDTAVDHDRLPGHVVVSFRGEVGYEARDILGDRNAAERDQVRVLRYRLAFLQTFVLGELLVDLVPHGGADDAGAVGVDGDAVLRAHSIAAA